LEFFRPEAGINPVSRLPGFGVKTSEKYAGVLPMLWHKNQTRQDKRFIQGFKNTIPWLEFPPLTTIRLKIDPAGKGIKLPEIIGSCPGENRLTD
jgi:hypothetical protein